MILLQVCYRSSSKGLKTFLSVQKSLGNLASPRQTRKHKCGNVMFAINVFLFAHLRKHCSGNKIGFPGSKNVSRQIQKNFCCGNNVSCTLPISKFSNVSNTRNIVFPIRHVKTMYSDYGANVGNTLRFMQANVSQQMFLRDSLHESGRLK